MKLLDGENCEGLTDLKWYLLDRALKLTLPKESHDLDRDSQHLSEEFEKAATYGGNENGSCIRIFKHRVEEKVKTKLKGHHKRITGIALSNSLNVLISAGAHSQDGNPMKETHKDEILSVELPAPPPWKKLWCKKCNQERKKQNYIQRNISFGSAHQLHLSTMAVHMNLIT